MGSCHASQKTAFKAKGGKRVDTMTVSRTGSANTGLKPRRCDWTRTDFSPTVIVSHVTPSFERKTLAALRASCAGTAAPLLYLLRHRSGGSNHEHCDNHHLRHPSRDGKTKRPFHSKPSNSYLEIVCSSARFPAKSKPSPKRSS